MENQQTKSNGNGEKRKRLLFLAFFAFLMAGVVALYYLWMAQSRVYVEKSSLEADTVDLSSQSGGILQNVWVKAGDSVSANQAIAQIGNDIVKSKGTGTIISVKADTGKVFAPGEAVATMIDPSDLRVVAQVEEDKGLSDIKVGQRAFFTVDAFGSKEYSGVVDEISPTSRSGDVVFNISNTREEKEFNVKIRFDTTAYPELKNGMSAKTWIYLD